MQTKKELLAQNKLLQEHSEKLQSFKMRKYKTPQEFEQKIKEYFEYCDNTILKTIEKIDKNGNKTIETIKKPPTMHGLYAYLDLHRRTFLRYFKKPGFGKIAKKAQQNIIKDISENLLINNYNTAGAIFLLKCYGLNEKNRNNGTNIQINNQTQQFKLLEANEETIETAKRTNAILESREKARQENDLTSNEVF